jgi:glutamate N-acetyltransferase/amino-acid N-acetyltransferase
MAGGREIDHDHRHLPEGRDRDCEDRQVTVTINGMAKGAGMIAPDMATMLSFIFTDAPISARALQSLLTRGVTDTFNAVTIDGDTSDLGHAAGVRDRRRDGRAAHQQRRLIPRLKHFRLAFKNVLANLAEQVARDGEGARKLVEIKVEGATSKASARKIAMSIANSPLVKTAIAGEDANWGRVVMAVGKAGEAGRPRQALDLVQRHPRGAQGRARPGL